MKKYMKNEYKHIFSIVKGIIDKIDPIGLLSQGAPVDEYDEEIHKIVSGLRTCDNVEKIQKLIYNIFKESFGQETAGNISLYLEAAKTIFKIIERY
jgi:hypothetical protein